jgi:hypothetical protein
MPPASPPDRILDGLAFASFSEVLHRIWDGLVLIRLPQLPKGSVDYPQLLGYGVDASQVRMLSAQGNDSEHVLSLV